jgi:hypothetical protein
VEKILRELILREIMADVRLAGSERFPFHEYKYYKTSVATYILQGTPMGQYLIN